MKILCRKCKRPVAFTSGKLVSIKRGDNMIQIVGEDFSALSTCSGNCGNHTAIMVERGKINQKDLLIEKEGEEDDKQKPNEKGSDNEGEPKGDGEGSGSGGAGNGDGGKNGE